MRFPETSSANASQSVTVSVQTADAITATISGDAFHLKPPGSRAQGAPVCQITITFTPSKIGAATGSLQVLDTVTKLSTMVTLSETLLAPTGSPTQPDPPTVPAPPTSPTLSAATLNMGNVLLGSAGASRSIGISSLNTDWITIKLATNAFQVTPSSCSGSCTLGIIFNPLVEGPATDTLIVTDQVTGLTASAQISGNGMKPPVLQPPTVSVRSLDFGTVQIGGTGQTNALSATTSYGDPIRTQISGTADYKIIKVHPALRVHRLAR